MDRKKRYAVVTGGNKGIGLETCGQLLKVSDIRYLVANRDRRLHVSYFVAADVLCAAKDPIQPVFSIPWAIWSEYAGESMLSVSVTSHYFASVALSVCGWVGAWPESSGRCGST
ncbi:hypothetical protein LXL04_020490 [Taraxacum kok-saghyz]